MLTTIRFSMIYLCLGSSSGIVLLRVVVIEANCPVVRIKHSYRRSQHYPQLPFRCPILPQISSRSHKTKHPCHASYCPSILLHTYPLSHDKEFLRMNRGFTFTVDLVCIPLAIILISIGVRIQSYASTKRSPLPCLLSFLYWPSYLSPLLYLYEPTLAAKVPFPFLQSPLHSPLKHSPFV